MRRKTILSGGAVGGGVLALWVGLGCLGTKVLLFLGLSGTALGGLPALEPYRLPFLFAAAAVLALAGWRIHRRSSEREVPSTEVT